MAVLVKSTGNRRTDLCKSFGCVACIHFRGDYVPSQIDRIHSTVLEKLWTSAHTVAETPLRLTPQSTNSKISGVPWGRADSNGGWSR